MKKLYLFPIAVVFLFLGAQAMASPPVTPPPEGFIIKSETSIQADGDVTESERYNWTYFEGVGNVGAETLFMQCQGDPQCLQEYYDFWVFLLELPWNPDPEDIVDRFIQKHGFQEGAEIAYQQDFGAIDGTTNFTKKFKAISHTSSTDPDNLTVDKDITYDNLGGTGFATHEEKVGLSVVSQGGEFDNVASAAAGLLTLCPWAGSGNGATTATTGNGCGECGCLPEDGLGIASPPPTQECDYPATNEGIAAGSSFKVTKLVGFNSKSRVNSVDNPALSYEVNALNGTGQIAAGFVVDLWEGAGCWGERDVFCYMGCCSFDSDTEIVQDPAPLVASRTSYAEHASADGIWSFTKKVSYASVMPTAAVSTGSFPFNQVP